ncbi:MAG: sigma-54-dependent Fis family transcriptional regulator [Ignavibacteriales bacterium]|nr:sigma-54-dependent Fis family transcriptional regulator [Ignavibacteriales bacterium]
MPQRFNILIVDDEASLTTILREELQASGIYEVDLAFDGVEAINIIQKKLFDVVLLDFKMPRVDGKEVLKFVQENSPSSQTIMISNFADLQMAVEMTKLGAYDVLGKPYDINQLEQIIERALERKKLSTENKLLQEELQRKAGTSEIIGNSKAMLDVLLYAKRVAESDSVVLILGPSGTGKELIANFIHKNSPRIHNPFVPVNCSSIPDSLLESELFGHEKGAFTNAYTAKPGLVEVANGGTLFLDEVGDISPAIQPKLLRFLENGTFRRVGGTNELQANVRVLSATNKNLQEEARSGRFREDLLYRLNVFTLRMPGLKDHLGDIPALVDFFLQKKSKSRQPKKISKDAIDALMMYNWPGNVRELEHVIERAIILSSGDVIEFHDLHLTDQQPEQQTKSFSLDDMEKEHIEKVLKIFKGNRSKVSEALGISQKTLYLKIKEYGIVVEN